jgi:hypothetical protein
LAHQSPSQHHAARKSDALADAHRTELDFSRHRSSSAQKTMAQPPLPAGARLGIDVRCGLLIKEGKTMRPDERKGLLRVLRVRCIRRRRRSLLGCSRR